MTEIDRGCVSVKTELETNGEATTLTIASDFRTT